MSIETRWYSPEPIRVAVWDGSPESLADLRELTGQNLVDDGGMVLVTLMDGTEVYPVRVGQVVYVDHIGIAVRDADRAGEWLTEDPRAAA